MNVIRFLNHARFLPEWFLLQLYPPFLFMGVKVISIASDYRHLHVKIPLRWYSKNMHGTLFGGFMCAVSDPLPTLLCGRLFPGVQVWTRRNSVEFLRPGKGSLDLRIEVTDLDIASIRESLQSNGQSMHTFEYCFRDKRGHVIAEVLNTVYLRKAKKRDASFL